MTRIEHIAMWTDDLERLARFYVKYFGATASKKYQNSAKGFESRFLALESGSRLELMSTTTLKPAKLEAGAQRFGLTHLALSLGSEAHVVELTGVLREAGYVVLENPRRTGDGYYESIILDPDGNRIELTV